MSGLLGTLIDSLEQQKQYYEELVLIAKEKRNIIVNNDLENLSKFNTVENMLISKNNKLDSQITEVIDDIGIVLNLDSNSLNISSIVKKINNEDDKKKLTDLSTDLLKLASKLKDYNNTNRELINTAMEYIEFSMNVLTQVDARDDAMEALSSKKHKHK